MMQRGLMVLVACAVAIAAGWMGWRAYSAAHPAAPNAVTVPAGLASAPNPSDEAPESAVAALRIPDLMPPFALRNLKGKLTPISTWAGKSLVLNFWATWCAPCQREIPLLKSLAANPALNDVQIVGIAVDYADKVADFADQHKISYPVLVGEQDALDIAAQLGVSAPAFPFTVFTDSRGEVVALFVGELHKPQVELILAQVEQLNSGKLPLAQAREKIASGLGALAGQTDKG